MSPLDAVLFEDHPDALLVLNKEGDRVLAANRTAQLHFGYSADTFSGLPAADLGLPEPALPRIPQDISATTTPHEMGVHHLRDAAGNSMPMRLQIRPINEEEAPSALLLFVQPVVAGAADECGEGYRQRATPQLEAPSFQALFEAAPVALLALEPREFRVVAASDDCLETLGLSRDAVLGQSVLNVFSMQQGDGAADSQRKLRTSLEYVREHALPAEMCILRVHRHTASSEQSADTERFLGVTNAPVREANGRKALVIVQRLEDLTPSVQENALELEGNMINDDRRGQAAPRIPSYAPGGQRGRDALYHQAATLRHIRRLVPIASWCSDPATGRFTFSSDLMAMLGQPHQASPVDFDTFLKRLHPNDRQVRKAVQDELLRSDVTLSCTYRIQRADGSVGEIEEVAESLSSEAGRLLSGVLRDITREKQTEQRLASLFRIVSLVGKSARFGGWSYYVHKGLLRWELETAAIHGLPDRSAAPSVDEAIAFYIPEHRPLLRQRFEDCVRHGKSFDEVLQLRTAQGELIWVRSIGAPEWDETGEVSEVHGSIQDVTELITAEARNDQLARHLRETLDHVNEGFITIDRDWQITFTNRSAAEMVGTHAERVIGRRLWDVVPALADTESSRRLRVAMQKAEPDNLIDHFKPLDRLVELRIHPTEEGLALHLQDVTDERVRHERLRLLETAVSRLNDIVLITEAEPIDEPEGPRIVFANEAVERRTGYTAEELIGKTPRILQGPETQRAALDHLRKAMEKWQPTRVELINYKRDGTPFWLELDLAPIADESGWFTHWVAVERDITDRKEAEEKARINAERFNLVARVTNDVIWDWDIEQDTVWRNEGAEALFGAPLDAVEHSAKSWKSRIHPEDRERVLSGIQGVIEGDDNRWLDEYRFVQADGSDVTVIDRGFVMRDANGLAIRMVGALNDVTERRELDERLRQSQKLETLGQLTGGVAHDFNNLLTVILGNAEVLGRRLSHDAYLKRLSEMTVTAAERGAELTNRLLSFARRQPLEPRSVDCDRQLQDSEILFKRALSEDISLTISRHGQLWPAEVDPHQLENALLNLVLNARDAMPAGGTLSIETANIRIEGSETNQRSEIVPGDYVLIAVRDSGKGMDRTQCARAFEPFYTTKEIGEGSGLGLSMVYGFVRQTGGHVELDSTPGQGTTVSLYLPRAHSEQDEPSEIEDATPTIGGSERILVVEDDPLVRSHLSEQLQSLGYRVSVASSGPSALELLEELEKVDLLFTDIVMPGGMNGRELAEEVTRLRPGIRTLFTSGYAESAIVHQGRLDPGVHLLSKPYRRQELANKLREVLDEE